MKTHVRINFIDDREAMVLPADIRLASEPGDGPCFALIRNGDSYIPGEISGAEYWRLQRVLEEATS